MRACATPSRLRAWTISSAIWTACRSRRKAQSCAPRSAAIASPQGEPRKKIEKAEVRYRGFAVDLIARAQTEIQAFLTACYLQSVYSVFVPDTPGWDSAPNRSWKDLV